jgi:hypothetical protein
VGEPEGKIPLRRLRRGCENDTKIKLKETGWGHVTWMHLAQNGKNWRAVSHTVINLGPSNYVNFLTGRRTLSLSRKPFLPVLSNCTTYSCNFTTLEIFPVYLGTVQKAKHKI